MALQIFLSLYDCRSDTNFNIVFFFTCEEAFVDIIRNIAISGAFFMNDLSQRTSLDPHGNGTEFVIAPQIALEIVDKIHVLTGYNSIVCDKNGIIIGAAVRERIGKPHAGAQAILADKCEEYGVSADEAAKNPNVKEGVSLPIKLHGKKIGTFGITGTIEIVRPFCAVCADTVSVKVREMAQKKTITDLVGRITAEINHVTQTVLKISSTSKESANAATNGATVADQTTKKVLDTNQILEISREIADQINLLGLNASIESARAGDYGRGFAVVASKIQKLAIDSSDSSKSINRILKEIQVSINEVAGATRKTAELSNAQAVSIQEIMKIMNAIQGLISGLETNFNEK